jgi:DNA-3-methyladenine glycosylase
MLSKCSEKFLNSFGRCVASERLNMGDVCLVENALHSDKLRRLTPEELPSDTAGLARFLIGKVVVRALPGGAASGRIVETEAYVTGDEASHSFRGLSARNKSMFLRRGHAYVYLAYGVSFMLNVSSGDVGIGEGVLIRAAEPLSGACLMQANRGDVPLRDLMRGPGRLAKALDIDRRLDGVDLCEAGPLWLGDDGFGAHEIGVSVRIGIRRDAHRPLRFFLRGSRFVSGPAALSNGPFPGEKISA